MTVRLTTKTPCECGASAKLEQVRKRHLALDGLTFNVDAFPQYRCPKCRRVWYPFAAIEELHRRAVGAILQQHVLSPARVRFARKALGLSQAEFAAALGIRGGKHLFSRYESGDVRPSSATVQAIALYIEKWLREKWRMTLEEEVSFAPFGYGQEAARPLKLGFPKCRRAA